MSLLKDYETHKSRGRLFELINEELNTAAKSIDVLLIMGLKEVFLQGFKATYNELKLKQLLNKMKVPISVGTVTPYAYETMQNYFNTYKTPFMKGWQDEQKSGIFKVIEEQALKGYNYGTAASNMKKMFGENPYGIGNTYYWKMVARTEGARVFTEASVKAAKDLEFEYKRVVVTQGCDVCWNMEAEGWIPIGQQFSMGDAPFHPHCMCHYDYKKEKESWSEADEYSQKEIDTMGQELLEYKEKQLNSLNQKIEDAIDEYDRTGELDLSRFSNNDFKTMEYFQESEIYNSLNNYKSSAYRHINGFLRLGEQYIEDTVLTTGEYDIFKDKLISNIADIKTALNKSSLTQDTLLYRGISSSVAKKLLDKGAVIDKGFQSWTSSKSIASKFSGTVYSQVYNKDMYAVLEVVVPKGLKALLLERGSSTILLDDLRNKAAAGWESEYLLDTNLKVNVVDTKIVDGKDYFKNIEKINERILNDKVIVFKVMLSD